MIQAESPTSAHKSMPIPFIYLATLYMAGIVTDAMAIVCISSLDRPGVRGDKPRPTRRIGSATVRRLPGARAACGSAVKTVAERSDQLRDKLLR
jgi:hypothetical protein